MHFVGVQLFICRGSALLVYDTRVTHAVLSLWKVKVAVLRLFHGSTQRVKITRPTSVALIFPHSERSQSNRWHLVLIWLVGMPTRCSIANVSRLFEYSSESWLIDHRRIHPTFQGIRVRMWSFPFAFCEIWMVHEWMLHGMRGCRVGWADRVSFG